MRIPLTIATLLLFLLGSCSGADRIALNKADAIMEQHPETIIRTYR